MSGNSSIKGKIAVVTGASGGIGRATAERLRDEGMRVIGVDINGDGLKVVPGIEHVVADLQMMRVAQKLLRLAKVHIL